MTDKMTSPMIINHIEHWAVERLVPFAANARTHSGEQIDQIAASIVEFGFVNPILAGGDGVIIAGHARLQAAQKLGMSAVPVIVLAHLSDFQIAPWLLLAAGDQEEITWLKQSSFPKLCLSSDRARLETWGHELYMMSVAQPLPV